MPTSFDVIEDIGLITINDYKLNKLYDQDQAKFQQRCDSLLVRGVPNFIPYAQTSLEFDLEAREFVSDLTHTEISILADYFALEWFDSEIQIAASVANTLQITGGFHTHSPAQALKEKSAYRDKLREVVSQKITEYQLEKLSDLDV